MKFIDAPYMSAGQKTHVFHAWARFVDAIARGESGDALLKRFTQPLYHHLIQHCSFIAHYNRGGFFGEYFQEPEDTARFFTQFDPDGPMLSIEYGYSWWVKGGNGTQEPYQDLNLAMCELMPPYLPTIRNLAVTRQKAIPAQGERETAVEFLVSRFMDDGQGPAADRETILRVLAHELYEKAMDIARANALLAKHGRPAV